MTLGSERAMNRPNLVPGGPSFLHILTGLCRIKHLKQFITFALSISVLLWISPLMRTRTFILIVGLGLLALGILSFIERFTAQNRTPADRALLLGGRTTDFGWTEPIDIPYEIKPFSLSDASTESAVCGICLRTMRVGTEAAYLPCLHAFHRHCFEQWIKVQNTCPHCKTSYV
jgi:hypothetical protein